MLYWKINQQQNASVAWFCCSFLALNSAHLKVASSPLRGFPSFRKSVMKSFKKGDEWGLSFHINPVKGELGCETPELMRYPRATPHKVDVTEEIKEASGWRSQGGHHPALSHIQWESQKGGRTGLTLESFPLQNVKRSHNLSTPQSSLCVFYLSSCEK